METYTYFQCQSVSSAEEVALNSADLIPVISSFPFDCVWISDPVASLSSVTQVISSFELVNRKIVYVAELINLYTSELYFSAGYLIWLGV